MYHGGRAGGGTDTNIYVYFVLGPYTIHTTKIYNIVILYAYKCWACSIAHTTHTQSHSQNGKDKEPHKHFPTDERENQLVNRFAEQREYFDVDVADDVNTFDDTRIRTAHLILQWYIGTYVLDAYYYYTDLHIRLLLPLSILKIATTSDRALGYFKISLNI